MKWHFLFACCGPLILWHCLSAGYSFICFFACWHLRCMPIIVTRFTIATYCSSFPLMTVSSECQCLLRLYMCRQQLQLIWELFFFFFFKSSPPSPTAVCLRVVFVRKGIQLHAFCLGQNPSTTCASSSSEEKGRAFTQIANQRVFNDTHQERNSLTSQHKNIP